MGGLTTKYPREYSTWENMKQRCNNPNAEGYKNYGGRGIKVCVSWDKFSNFIKDMGPKPSAGHSIDRINNNLGYYKDNCRWATQSEQANNTSKVIIVDYYGETITLSALSSRLGISKWTLSRRIKRGEPMEVWSRKSQKTGELTRVSRITGIPRSTLKNRMIRNKISLQEAAFGWSKK